ncbi:hypothetical protein BRC85_09610 [Halobacteriales archaeon QS_1_69_70]|nr:MAG: hypothetical protein BRC85_09610 [Halobacteriales archaeon QS_1_69_70]
MSDQNDDPDLDLSRRAFVKTTGVAAGATALGAGATATAGAATSLDERFLNWRTLEARKVWARGYRGRPDRALALTDSGIAAEHPELGPWNDVLLEKDGEDIDVKRVSTTIEEQPVTERVEAARESFDGTQAVPPGFLVRTSTHDFLVPDLSVTPNTARTESFSGIGAGLFVGVGYNTPYFPVPGDVDESQYDGELVAYRVDATLSWEPSNPEEDAPEPTRAKFELQDGDGNVVESSDQGYGTTNTSSETYRRVVADVEPGDYRFFAYANRGINEWEIEAEVQVVTDAARIDRPEDVAGYEVAGELVTNETTGSGASVEVILRDENGDAVGSASSGGDQTTTFDIDATAGQYRFEVVTTSDVSDWTLDTTINAVRNDRDEDGSLVTEPQEVVTTSGYDGDPVPDVDEPTADTPKTIGWYTHSDRYTRSKRPVDPNGHGSHVSGIMAGSGRASRIDTDNTTVHRPQTVLLPTDFVEYTVSAPAGTTVFASAFGEGVVVEILGPDDEVIHEAPLRADSIVADEPARHGSGAAEYTIRVRPLESRSATGIGSRAQAGTPAAARLKRIAVGTYRQPDATAGARTPLADDEHAVHPGLAPNQSLVGLTGLLGPTNDLGDIADDLADVFNVRAVNMSWGPSFGLPVGQFGGALDPVWNRIFAADAEETLNAIETAARNGILTVAAAGNAFTPANGNGFPAIADEAVSVAATGPLDGITSYSSGGLGGRDEDDGSEVYGKPDVTAPGGDIEPDAVGYVGAGTVDDQVPVDVNYPLPSRKELVRSAMAPGSTYDDNAVPGDPPRDHFSAGGTSMASPYVCGMGGLLAQAMEEDAPDSIRLPAPGEAGIEDVLRLKQAILATANETAFTAAPYHTAKAVPSTPSYQHGGRDPYEGYGRANPDAAVDAVTRDLLGGTPDLGDDPVETTYGESVGLYVPEDSRAVAGHVRVPGGDLEASIDFTDYGGGNAGMATGAPHLDLFVYDAEQPAENGEPNIVASAQGRQGSASVSVGVDRGDREDPTERTFLVVAKIVNVPGAVNGFDVQANFDLGLAFEPAAGFDPVPVDLEPSGSRSDDGAVFTGGQTDRVIVTVEDFNEELTDAVTVTDTLPSNWDVDEEYGDVESYDDGTVTFEGTVSAEEVAGDGSVDLVYYAEAPEGAAQTGAYGFGPAEAEATDPREFSDDPDRTQGSTSGTFGGTDTNTVVGPSSDA